MNVTGSGLKFIGVSIRNVYNRRMEIRDDQVFTVSKDVLFQEVSGETVLLDLESEQYFGLDAVGTRIWSLLNEGQAVSGMVEALLVEYEVERGQLEADVRELLAALLDAGLIEGKDAD